MRMRFKPYAHDELMAADFHVHEPLIWGGKWHAQYARPEQPFVLELGCGKGGFISQLACAHPENNYLGIDITDKVLILAKRKIEAAYTEAGRPIDNVKIMSTDIERIKGVITAEDTVSRIYINFCNPWSKNASSNKHRLTYPRQLIQYRDFLKDGGEIYFKTDDDDLFRDSLEYFPASGYDIIWQTYDLHENEPEWNIRTEHEGMFTEMGIKIKALIARKDPDPASVTWIEPKILKRQAREAAEAAAKAAMAAAKAGKGGELPHVFTGSVEHAIAHIEESIQGKVDNRFLRWYAVKLFERDDKVQDELKLDKTLMDHIDEHIQDCEKEMDDDAESIITNQRYAYINTVVGKAVKKKARVEHLTISDKVDQIVTNRVLALPIFAVIMYLMYSLSVGTSIADGGWAIGTFATDWTNDVLFGEIVPGALGGFLESIGVAGWLYGLIMDGIVAGVGAVLGFVPQMLVLFFLLSILEDVGYMSRVAFIMDRIFRKFGLSGKSFIPMLIGSGCGVPAVMASRTIEQERDRRMTIMTTCFIPCGAKMPIIGLIAGAIFGGSSLVAVSAYFIGMAAIICSGVILKKTKLFAGDPAPFVMELPAYHVPAWGNVFRATWERGWSFIKRAGSVILAATVVLWFLQGFGFENGAFGMVEDQDNSVLAAIATKIAWIFAPLGFGNWKATVASVSGLIAKENVVGTFGVLYHFGGEELSENGDEIWNLVAADYTALSAYAFMIFNLLCAPCFAAMGAIKREMNNGKWTAIAIGYMCALAYCAALVVYQIGGLITGEVGFNFFTIVAAVILVAFIYLLVRPNKYVNDNEVKIDVSKIK